MSEIGDLLRKITDMNIRLPEVCKVVSTANANTEYTIDVVRYYDPEYSNNLNTDDFLIKDVRLNILGQGSYSIPQIGSFILVIWDEQDVPYCFKMNEPGTSITQNRTNVVISMFQSYIQGNNVQITGTESTKIDGTDIFLNGGNYGGLIIIEKLIERINLLEDRIKQHQHLYVTPAGSPAPTTLDSVSNPGFINIKAEDIENTTVKHGNKDIEVAEEPIQVITNVKTTSP